MNAIQFIKDHGVDKAREVVEGAPEGAEVYVDVTKTYFSSPSRLYDFDLSAWENMDRGMDLDLYEDQIWLEDLNQHVVSLNIIKDLNGIKGAKATLYNLVQLDWDEFEHRYIDNWICTKARLEQSIADYGTVYECGFNVGDLVVCTDENLENKYLTVKKITGFIDDWGLELNDGEHWVNTDRFRHATPEEIAAGHRIDVQPKERPISRKRARKLRKRHGVSVYFSKRLECLVWVKTA